MGLKFKLFSCEVLFNRALCYLNLEKHEKGLADLEHASKEAQTEDHNSLTDALKKRGEGYNVYSVPAGIIYRPSEAKIRNAETRDYLGHAKLIAATNPKDKYTGFTGVDLAKSVNPSLTTFNNYIPETEALAKSFAASNLVDQALISQNGSAAANKPSVAAQQLVRNISSRSGTRPTSPVTPHPPTPPLDGSSQTQPQQQPGHRNSQESLRLQRRPTIHTNHSTPELGIIEHHPINPLRARRPSLISSTLPKSESNINNARWDEHHDQIRDMQMPPRRTRSSSRSRFPSADASRPFFRSNSFVRQQQPLGRSASIAYGASQRSNNLASNSDDLTDVYDEYYGESHSPITTPSPFFPPTTTTSSTTRAGPRLMRSNTSTGVYGRARPYGSESDLLIESSNSNNIMDRSDSPTFDSPDMFCPPPLEILKLKVKAYLNDGKEPRLLLIQPTIQLPDLIQRMTDKFSLSHGNNDDADDNHIQLKIKDETDGDLISILDQEELDVAVASSVAAARQKQSEIGSMELWVLT